MQEHERGVPVRARNERPEGGGRAKAVRHHCRCRRRGQDQEDHALRKLSQSNSILTSIYFGSEPDSQPFEPFCQNAKLLTALKSHGP